jgi:hypothetical protein
VGTKTIEHEYPGKSAAQVYAELEKVIGSLSERFGLTCGYDPASRTITVPEKMGVSGSCQAADGRAKVVLTYGLLGSAVAGKVQAYIESKMVKLFT